MFPLKTNGATEGLWHLILLDIIIMRWRWYWDINNDGLPDIIYCNSKGHNKLYLNGEF